MFHKYRSGSQFWGLSLILVCFLALIVLTGCGGGGGGGSTVPTSNVTPIADAGGDQVVATGTTIYLDGSGSSDANGDAITYSWELTEKPIGSSAELSFSNIINPIFNADIDGIYTVQLIVNDGTEDSIADTLAVMATTSNISPVANAGADQSVVTWDTVNLDGSGSTDANGDTLTYNWSMVRPGGSSAILFFSPSSGLADFTPDVDGTYTVQLVVNDGIVDSTADTLVVTATTANIPPVANAGADQTAVTWDTVNLDGSGSSDANGDTLTYTWSIINAPSGSSAILFFSPSSGLADFTPDVDGTYMVQLVVNDGMADSTADTLVVTATTANIPPVADAGADQTVVTWNSVILDGNNSSDANGDTLTYDWSMVRPGGSSAILFFSTSSGLADFTPDVDGTYMVQLVVNDGMADSTADTLVVTAIPNIAPIADAGADQTVTTGATVYFSGSGSTDANGDTLTYNWSMVRPGGSSAILFTSGADGQFTPDINGNYIIELIVNDGLVDSTPDTMIVTSQ